MTITEMNSPFSEGLSEVIKEKGLRQVYVAERAGYTPQELSDMLNGRRLIKACDIPRLTQALGVTSDDIYAAGKGE
ncbi:MAG: helix-turn-helix transcriptional regulator [Muricomes sp.]